MTHDTNDRGHKNGHQLNRRRLIQGCGASLAFALAGGGIGTVTAEHDEEDEDFESIPELLASMPDNWGRWGSDDGLGVLNVLGSEEMFDGMTAAKKRGKINIERFTLQAPTTGFGIDELVGEAPDDDNTTTDTGDAMFPGRFPARRDNWADAHDDTDDLTTPGGMEFADDAFVTPLYLQGATHCDALGHGWYDGEIYNGHPDSTTHTKRAFDFDVTGIKDLKDDPEIGAIAETHGLGEADISFAAGAGIAGRGVLLDVGRHKGTEGPDDNWLPLDTNPLGVENPDAAITLEDLKATADAQGVTLKDHDILLIRTGAIERTADPNAQWDPLGEPGLKYSDELVRWVHDKDIPYIGADNLGVEQLFQTVTEDDLEDDRAHLHGDYALPLHGAFLRDLGVTLNEVLDLSDLAAQCAEDGVYDFLFTAAPLHVEMGTGAPVNPVVIKAIGQGENGNEDNGNDDPDDTENEDNDDNGDREDNGNGDRGDGNGDDNGNGNRDNDNNGKGGNDDKGNRNKRGKGNGN